MYEQTIRNTGVLWGKWWYNRRSKVQLYSHVSWWAYKCVNKRTTQLASQHFICALGPDRVSFWQRSAPTDSRTMAGRPELCLSKPREREPEPPHRAANLTNGRLRLCSHQPKRLQEGPEKWHRRGDYLPGSGWKDILKDEKIRADLRKGQKEDWPWGGG